MKISEMLFCLNIKWIEKKAFSCKCNCENIVYMLFIKYLCMWFQQVFCHISGTWRIFNIDPSDKKTKELALSTNHMSIKCFDSSNHNIWEKMEKILSERLFSINVVDGTIQQNVNLILLFNSQKFFECLVFYSRDLFLGLPHHFANHFVYMLLSPLLNYRWEFHLNVVFFSLAIVWKFLLPDWTNYLENSNQMDKLDFSNSKMHMNHGMIYFRQLI